MITNSTLNGLSMSFAPRTGQQANTVAIGTYSGAVNTTQNGNAIAIGSFAGYTGQGANAIAIGLQAGYSSQNNNSIVINATGGILNSATANATYIAPVRGITGGTKNVLMTYDTSFNEVQQATDISYGVSTLALNKTTDSFGTTTGALTVSGGIGVGGNVYVGGNIYMKGVLVGSAGFGSSANYYSGIQNFKNTTPVSVPSSTLTTVSLGSAIRDTTQSGFSLTYDAGNQWYINQSGNALSCSVTFTFQWTPNSLGSRVIFITHSSLGTVSSASTQASTYETIVQTCSSTVTMLSNETLQFRVYQTSGSSLSNSLTIANFLYNYAGYNLNSGNAISIGSYAGYTLQSGNAIAIGYLTGYVGQGGNAVAIGTNAGQTNQSSGSIAIGLQAGQGTQGGNSIAIGVYSGFISQGGNAVAIGSLAGNYSQGQQGIAIGTFAGQTVQGQYCVAVGTNSGQSTQGQYAVAIGQNAGQYTQGQYCVAVGNGAGNNFQGLNAISIGKSSGQYTQGINAISIGTIAGGYSQGANSIAIGTYAGQTSQPTNSIVINATGSVLNGTTSNSCYINPIRNTGVTSSNILAYDTSSNEVFYTNNLSLNTIISSNSPKTWYCYANTGGNGTTLTGNTIGANTNSGSYFDTTIVAGGASTINFNNATATFTAPSNGLYYIQLSLFCNSPNTVGRTIALGGTGVNSGLGIAEGGFQYCIFNISSTSSSEICYSWNTLNYMTFGQTIYFYNQAGSASITFFYAIDHSNLKIIKVY